MVQYALGCAFNLDEILINFPYKKLLTNCALCKKIIGDNHRNILVKRIFTQSLKLVLSDIIENNITFWLPLTGNIKSNIHIRRVQGNEFKRLRQNGKWKDVDIVNSFFSGYEVCLFMFGQRTPRVKKVYISRQFRDQITFKTNQGFSYGDSNKDMYLKDYYPQLFSIFPNIPEVDIKRILIFSWKALYLHNSYGGDTFIFNKDVWCYIGNLKKNPLQHFNYYIKKLLIKMRVLYKRKNIQWDGNYYFALTDNQYKDYLSQKNKKGRPKKYFNFGSIFLYQTLDECRLSEHSKRYIFKVESGIFVKNKYYISNFKSDRASLLEIRAPLKFKDILVSNNKYEFI